MLTVALRKFSVKARHPVRVAVWCFAPVGIPRCAGGVGEGWGEKEVTGGIELTFPWIE